jgi:hypothetical protein
MDPWGNMTNFMTQFRQMMNNPTAFMQQRGFNTTDPNMAIQQMMNQGKLSQQQYNAARQASERIMSNPMFRQFFG